MKITQSISYLLMALPISLAATAAQASTGTLIIDKDTVLTEDHTGPVIIGAENITLDCNGHTVTRESSTNFRKVGINFVKGFSRVTNCKVTGADVGIEIQGGSGVTIDHNVIHNVHVGIAMVNHNLGLIEANEVFDTSASGIIVASLSNNELRVADNFVHGTGEGVVVLAGDHPDPQPCHIEVVNNTLTDLDSHGVSVELLLTGPDEVLAETSLIVDHNKIHRVGGDGLTVHAPLHLSGTGNRIRDARGHGFDLGRLQSLELVGNSVLRSTGFGLRIDGIHEGAVVTGNQLASNEGGGLSVVDSYHGDYIGNYVCVNDVVDLFERNGLGNDYSQSFICTRDQS